jgi:hypothetical protein
MLPTTLANLTGQRAIEPAAGTKADSESSHRTSGAVSPRGLIKLNEMNSLSYSARISHGRNKRFSNCSTKSSTSNTTQTTSRRSETSWGLHYAIPRTKRPDRPENAEEILDKRVEYAFDEDAHDDPHNKREGNEEDDDWETDDDICTDGGTVAGFFDISHHNHGTIRSEYTLLISRILNGRW